MQVISLFSGIGGFELASDWMGWKNIVSCEINEFCNTVLKYYWPNAYHHGDIHTLNYDTIRQNSAWSPGEPTIVVGGFPCQPYSLAGKRQGKEDERHLWPEMLRVIREVQPCWVVGENVYGLLNWSGGLVFDEVQADLEAEGYEVWPVILPACGVGAPHKRDRIWFIAHSSSQHRPLPIQQWNKGKEGNDINRQGERRITTNTMCKGFQERIQPGERSILFASRKTQGRSASRTHTKENWDKFPTQSPIRSRNDGLSSGLSGITVSKHRNESLNAYGNSVVPQIVFQIFKSIQDYDKAAENQAKLLGQKDRAKKFNKAGKKLWNDTVK